MRKVPDINQTQKYVKYIHKNTKIINKQIRIFVKLKQENKYTKNNIRKF